MSPSTFNYTHTKSVLNSTSVEAAVYKLQIYKFQVDIQDPAEQNRYTRKELLSLSREKAFQRESQTNDRSTSAAKENTISETTTTIDIESDNLDVTESIKMQISPGEPGKDC